MTISRQCGTRPKLAPCKMPMPIAKRWCAPPTRTGSSPRCSRRRSGGGISMRSMPSTAKSHACASSPARRCRARSACNGGAMSSRGEARGEVSANPVAAALLDTVAKCGLPLDPLIRLIDAHAFDLYDDAMATLADLDAYGRDTDGALMSLAARVLCRRRRGGCRRKRRHRLRGDEPPAHLSARCGAAAAVRAAGASRSPRRRACRDRGAPELAGAAGGARGAARPRRERVRRVSSRGDGDPGALRAGFSARRPSCRHGFRSSTAPPIRSAPSSFRNGGGNGSSGAPRGGGRGCELLILSMVASESLQLFGIML